MSNEPNTHLVDLIITSAGFSPGLVRFDANACDELAKHRLAQAEFIAAGLEPHIVALREVVAAGEEAGWDGTENEPLLNAGREAQAALLGPRE